jgi:starch synthase
MPSQATKLTYTAPNRAWHYRYAREFHSHKILWAFITGSSRFSPRASLPEIGDKLKRRDLIQNLYLIGLRARLPEILTAHLNRLSNRRLDHASYKWAKDSDVFLYYRTTGYETTRRLKSEQRPALCVLEEVNSHVDQCHDLMKEEFDRLDRGPYRYRFPDHDLRLKAYEAADCILCPSSFVKASFLKRGFPEERLLKVNFGFTFPEANNRVSWVTDPPKDTFRVLYVGQIHFRKGLRYAIEAFRRLKHPKKEFRIVGPRTEVTGLERTSIPEDVRFTGILKGEELEAAYRESTVFLLPTIEEGLALVLGEAMAHGLPVITTTHSGAEDILTDGIEGYILDPGDVESMTVRLQELADDPDKRVVMSEAASAKARLLGGWDVAVGKLLAEFHRVLGETNP